MAMIYYTILPEGNIATWQRGGVKLDKLIDLNKLQEYMKKNNISEVKLAKMIGVDYTTVYRVFRGLRKPGAKFITGLINSNIDLEIFLNKALPSGNKTTA